MVCSQPVGVLEGDTTLPYCSGARISHSVVSDSLQHLQCNLPGSSALGLPSQEYWNGLPFPTPGDLLDPGIEPGSPESPALTGRFFTTEPFGKPTWLCVVQTHRTEHLQRTHFTVHKLYFYKLNFKKKKKKECSWWYCAWRERQILSILCCRVSHLKNTSSLLPRRTGSLIPLLPLAFPLMTSAPSATITTPLRKGQGSGVKQQASSVGSRGGWVKLSGRSRSCSVIPPVNCLSADSWVVVPAGMLPGYSCQKGQKESWVWEGMITRDLELGG